MPFSIWTLGFLAFFTPGVVFLTAFALSARFRRSQPGDVFSNVLALFLASLTIGAIAALIDAYHYQSLVPNVAEILANKSCAARTATVADCEELLSDVASMSGRYLFWSSVLSIALGVASAKLIVWGIVPLGVYHGTLYPVLKGFFRYEIVVTIVSRLTIERMDLTYEKPSQLPVMYRGTLHDISIGHDGTIEYVAIRKPSKGFFIPPGDGHALRHASDHFTPIGLDEWHPADPSNNRRAKSTDFVLIEAADIQNIYFTQLPGASVDAHFIGNAKRMVLRYWTLFGIAMLVILLVANTGFAIWLFILAPLALPLYDALRDDKR